MILDERIKFFEEILEQEPSSKLFFQLAKLYFEKGDIDRCISTLKMGLEKNPDHVEARLLLIELLSKNKQNKEANFHTEKIHSLLTTYSAFWKNWADLVANKGNYELALIISLLSIIFKNGTTSNISESLYNYLNSDQSFKGEHIAIDEHTVVEAQKKDMDNKVGTREEGDNQVKEEIDFKTKTMADILMAQGDFKGAINIYRELLEKESDEAKIAELNESIKQAEKKLSQLTITRNQTNRKDKAKKKKLLVNLKKLANRLEARAI